MSDQIYIAIAGFGWSGSSAVVDLLKECKGTYCPKYEFRIIKDPYGLDDLYHNLVANWDILNSDNAIRDFRWHLEHMNKKSSKYRLDSGFGYSEILGDSLLKYGEAFIKELVDYEYDSKWFFMNFKRTKAQVLEQKIRHLLFGQNSVKSKMVFAKPSHERFVQAARKYIDALFTPLAEAYQANRIVLDQGISPQKFEVESAFLPSVKMIVVDRDPRDIYTDLALTKALIGREFAITHDASKYVQWHRGVRAGTEKLRNHPNVLSVHFEDLVLHYEDTIESIFGFLDIDLHDHVSPKQFFDPSISKKNVGLWKDYLTDSEIGTLCDELGEDLYQ